MEILCSGVVKEINKIDMFVTLLLDTEVGKVFYRVYRLDLEKLKVGDSVEFNGHAKVQKFYDQGKWHKQLVIIADSEGEIK